MASSRLDTFKAMVEQDPTNPLVRFGLANELLKAEQYEEARTALLDYLAIHDDEGAAFRMLGQACEKLGRFDDARDAYRRGIDTAMRHSHPTMAGEFQTRLDDLEDM